MIYNFFALFSWFILLKRRSRNRFQNRIISQKYTLFGNSYELPLKSTRAPTHSIFTGGVHPHQETENYLQGLRQVKLYLFKSLFVVYKWLVKENYCIHKRCDRKKYSGEKTWAVKFPPFYSTRLSGFPTS